MPHLKRRPSDRYSEDPRGAWAEACDRTKERVLSDDFEHQSSTAMEEAENLLALARKLAGVACEHCNGHGTRWYPSTATWHGGMGGSSMTMGVCDRCWGSGRTDQKGANLRSINSAIRKAESESSARWLMERIGAGLSTQRANFTEIAAKLRRARWSNFWVSGTAEAVAAALEEMASAEKEATP